MKSWKTTLGGVGALLTAAGMIVHNLQVGNWDNYKEIIGLVTAGWIGLHARDNNVTSEQAGAK